MWLLLSQICKILNKNNVKYIIIGGMSVAYHGYFRVTTLPDGRETDKYDFDIWYRMTTINYMNLANSLEELGFDTNKNTIDYTKFEYFRKSFDKYQLDFIPLLENFSLYENKLLFKKFYNRRDISDINNISIPFISKDDLIYIKGVSNRPKDIRDIQNLK